MIIFEEAFLSRGMISLLKLNLMQMPSIWRRWKWHSRGVPPCCYANPEETSPTPKLLRTWIGNHSHTGFCKGRGSQDVCGSFQQLFHLEIIALFPWPASEPLTDENIWGLESRSWIPNYQESAGVTRGMSEQASRMRNLEASAIHAGIKKWLITNSGSRNVGKKIKILIFESGNYSFLVFYP